MSLDYRLSSYHRIGSPTDPARVLRDRPLECALCHTDRSVEQLVATMESWWGKRYDRGALRALYGADLGVNAIRAALTGKPHEQGTAIGVLGERKAVGAERDLAPLLAHRLPILRFFARHAIESITGKPLPLDLHRNAAALKVEVRRYGDMARKRSWLSHVRGLPGALCPRCGTPLERSVAGGRTTYSCPHCQPAPHELTHSPERRMAG